MSIAGQSTLVPHELEIFSNPNYQNFLKETEDNRRSDPNPSIQSACDGLQFPPAIVHSKFRKHHHPR